MRPALPLLAMVLLAACNKPAAVAPSNDATAMAAAERKAIADTDAALAASRASQMPGTN